MWRYKGPSSLVSPTFESPGVNQLSPFYSSYRLRSRKKFSFLALSPSLDVTIKVQLYQYLGIRQIHLTALCLYKVNTVRQNRLLLTHALDLRILYHQSVPYA